MYSLTVITINDLEMEKSSHTEKSDARVENYIRK